MGVEAESKSRGLATTVKTLAHILVSFTEFKLEKMSLNLSYTMLNGETNCFQASSYSLQLRDILGHKKAATKLLCFS